MTSLLEAFRSRGAIAWLAGALAVVHLCAPACAEALRPPPPTASPSPTPLDTERPSPEPTDTPSPEPTATVTPSPSPAPLPPSERRTAAPKAAHPQWIDGTFGLIGAVWKCATFAGTPMTHSFSRDDTGQNLTVNTDVSLADGRSATVHEKYTHHPGDHDWTATLAGGMVVVTAPEWTGDTWIFSGTSTDAGKTSSVEMIYRRIGTNAFRREFRRLAGGAWVTYAGELCDRPMHF